MGFLVILLGLHQLLTMRRAPSARALFLGSGLVMVGLIQVVGEGSSLRPWLDAAAWPVLVVALFCSYRDGTLGETFRCRRRAPTPAESATGAFPSDGGA